MPHGIRTGLLPAGFALSLMLTMLGWSPLDTASAQTPEPEKKPPTEVKPNDEQPATTKPAETKPTETKPADAKPAEAKKPEAEKKPEEKKPDEKKPEPKKPESKKADDEKKPTETKPADPQPTESKPEPAQPEPAKPAETKPAETKPAPAKPAETKPAETTSTTPEPSKPEPSKPAPTTPAAVATPAATAPAADAASFADLKQKWIDIREKLFAAQVDYKNAPPAERAPIVEQFTKLRTEGEALQAQLLQTAEVLYKADAKNTETADFLAAFASGLYGADRYDESLRVAEVLIAGNYANKRIYNLAGKAAFNLSDFDKAEKYLKTAQDASAIDLRGEKYLGQVPAYRTAWKRELELRAAEAKADDLPRVSLQTTDGEIVLELFENEAPQTVGNFVSLVEKGYYDGLAFHRVLSEFMAQGGDPNGDGTGGPGYEIPCECYKESKRIHFRGSLSMAHRGKDTGGSQFFITFLPTANLDGPAIDPKNTGACHTVFGRVIKGEEVLAKLQRREPPDFHSSRKEPPPAADKIVTAKVIRKRDHAYEPTKVGGAAAAAAPAPTATETPAATTTPAAATPATTNPATSSTPPATTTPAVPEEKK